MKIKIYNTEHEMTEEEVSRYTEHLIDDASEMQSFIRFLADYAYTARVAGEAVRGALIAKLHECLRMYPRYRSLSKIRPILEKEMHFFKPEALRHHEFMKQQYGPAAQVVE